jgi:hypothetical protein
MDRTDIRTNRTDTDTTLGSVRVVRLCREITEILRSMK